MNFNRRDFLKIGMLSASALTFSACGRPVEHGIVSQYSMPEYKCLGEASFWASTCTELRSDCAVSVKTVENRAVQVSGIAGHFFTKGTPNSTAISGLQILYHPGRIKATVGVAEGQSPAATVVKAAKDGAVFIVDRLCGSAGDAIVEAARATKSKIWVCDHQQSVRERRILKAVTGRAELPLYDLENRDYLVTVGSNMLQENYAHGRTGWAYGRFRKTPGKLRGRMVSFSSRMNSTDANSDVWQPVAPGSEPYVLAAVGTLLSAQGKGAWPAWAKMTPAEAAERCGILDAEREEFAHRLEQLAVRLAGAESPLVVGGFQGPNGDATVFLAHTMTKMLNGDVVTFDPDKLIGSQKGGADLFIDDSQVSNALQSASAAILVNVDLVYRFPWLADAYGKVKNRVVLATMPNESTNGEKGADGFEPPKPTHVIPLRTWMEDWGDLVVTSPAGSWYGLQQPVVTNQVAAAYSLLGFMLELAKEAGATVGKGELSPRRFLQRELDDTDWENLLVRGGHYAVEEDSIYPNHAAWPPPVTANAGAVPTNYNVFADLPPLTVNSMGEVPKEMSLVVLPTHLGDGHLADRPWMQELPDAMTTVVWDSWIEIADSVADMQKIKRHDIVSVKVGDKEIKGSAYPSPFIHPNAVGIPSGRGQTVRPIQAVVDVDWVAGGSNPKKLLAGAAGSAGYFSESASGVTVTKGQGSRLLATFDTRVYNLPRHILPE